MTTKTFPWSNSEQRTYYFDQLISKLELQPVWDYVEAHNAPDARGDTLLAMMHYHSTEHMKQVTAIALWLLYEESEADWQYDCGALPLAVACMFHDMNHTLGWESDAENIARAQAAFKEYLNVTQDCRIVDHADIILDLIGITQFPYAEDREPKNLIERCIRDADILYGMQDDMLDYVMFALRREVNNNKEMPYQFTAEDWASGRIDFLKDVTIYTESAKEMMNRMLSDTYPVNHQAAIADWMRHEVVFETTFANKLPSGGILFIDTPDDGVPSRYLIERIEDVGSHLNIHLHDGQALSLANGELCVIVKRNKK